MKRFILLSIFLSVILAIAGCQTSTVPEINDVSYASSLSDERVLVQSFNIDGVSEEEIQDAILQAARSRGWEVTDPGEDGIVTELTHRDFESTLTFEYGSGWVKIYSLSYKIDEDTLQRIERDEPEGWIRNLHKDILEILGRLPT